MDNDAARVLRDIRILDAADDAFALCGKLLAGLGARVTRLPRAAADASKPRDLRSRFNLNGPEVIVGGGEPPPAAGEWLREADVLIESRIENKAGITGLIPRETRLRHSRLIHLFISPFGCTGPKRQYRSSAQVLSAAGGEMFACRDAGGKPSVLYGAQPYLLASIFGAVAVLMHLRKRSLTGKGSFMDLSVQEAVASAMNYAPAERPTGTGDSDGDKSSFPHEADFPVLPCIDGYVQLALTGNWQTLAEILAAEMEAPDLLHKQWLDPAYRGRHSGRLAEIMGGWARKHTRRQLFELGQAMGYPWAPVCSLREVLESPQLEFRGFFTTAAAKVEAQEMVSPGSPYRFIAPPVSDPEADPGNRDLDSATARSCGYSPMTDRVVPCSDDCPSGKLLRGIRVLDLTRMLSGPYCTRTLADFGAEVLKIQTRKASTGAERNNTPYFAAWNRNKRSITLDLGTEVARELFLKLVSTSDVVVENYSPRVMANWGLPFDRLREINPAIIMLSLSAMGQTGPWKNYVGFAPTFHALSGLLAASSGAPGQGHARIGYAHADIVAGLYGVLSLLAAIRMKERTGQGCHVDLSCYESTCTFLGPMRAESRADRLKERLSLHTEHSAALSPDMCCPCKGEDSWCALTIEDEAAWKELCTILADPELYSENFCSVTARAQNMEDLKARITRWTSVRTAQAVEKTLQDAGIAACAVQSVEDLVQDPQLEARNFFVPLTHPLLGETFAGRSAVWPCRADCSNWRPAPSMGEANHDIFVKLLGIPETAFRDYVRRGIIG